MPRRQGARNAGYEQRRSELVSLLRRRLDQRGAAPPSWRELAAAADVSLSTLAHYFGKRDDVVRAVMVQDLASGAEPLEAMARPTGSFAQSVRDALEHMVGGFRHGGIGPMFARGLIEGLRHEAIGPAFLECALEPTLAAAERRLRAHIERGEMRPVDPRGPALALVAPVLLAFLHQDELGGASVRPLDIDAFVAAHAAAFVRAWEVEPGSARPSA
jgi:AcrR family transcriptional regulator